MTQPDFWSKPKSLRARLLAPFSHLFDLFGWLNQRSALPDRIEIPVICIGNVNVGGAGKTPTALAIADRLKDVGLKVHFLTRGYLGRLRGPLRVDLAHHDAGDVGDEPMLLAAHAPTWVSKDRAAGAMAAVRAGAQIIVMDDGFQNQQLYKDLSIVVIDGGAGFGNGRVMPAGPLREPVSRALARADAVTVIGGGESFRPDIAKALAGYGQPVLRAHIEPLPIIRVLAGKPLFAFAGIGRPEKFFDMLVDQGMNVVGTKGFADHHDFTTDDMMELTEAAGNHSAQLVTTAKDFARLDDDARAVTTIIPVMLTFEHPDILDQVLAPFVPDTHKAAF